MPLVRISEGEAGEELHQRSSTWFKEVHQNFEKEKNAERSSKILRLFSFLGSDDPQNFEHREDHPKGEAGENVIVH